jgi:hypothetical protein
MIAVKQRPWRWLRDCDRRGWLYALRRHTTCRLPFAWVHSRRKVRKYDSGRYPLLCRYCRAIVGHDAYG